MTVPAIKTLWGIAKSPELSLSDEELHLLVQARTGKESLKKLTQREIALMAGVLQGMKDSASGTVHKSRKNKGNTATASQRRKIHMLARDLGWDNPARVNGMCKKMFGVSCVEWLKYQQCSKLIEALKAMLEREGTNENGTDDQGKS